MEASEVLESVIDALGSLPAGTASSLSDGEAISWAGLVERLGRRIDALRVEAAGELAERSRRELGLGSLARQHGLHSGGQLLESVTRISAADAGRRIRLARDTSVRVTLTGEVLPPVFPQVAVAVRSGSIGVDAALTITRHLTDAARTATPSQLAEAETHLVDAALTSCPELVAIQARTWRAALDPDGAEPRDRELRGHRRFVIGREVDGMTPFWGQADPVSAAQLRAWLGERTAPDRQPRFLDCDDLDLAADTNGSDPVSSDRSAAQDAAFADPRTREQRSFDALLGLLQAGVRADTLTTTPLQSAANVMVFIDHADLLSGHGIARLADVDEPISATTAGTLACEAGIQPIVIDAHRQPLALGRRQRYFAAWQRKVLAARDGGCAWIQCTAPPSWTHAHHILPWSQNGPTDITNGVLLCAFHHHLLHEDEFRIRIRDGQPQLLAPVRLDTTQTWHPMGRQGHLLHRRKKVA